MALKTGISLVAFASLLLPAMASAQSAVAPTLTLTTSKTAIVANANPSYSDLPTVSWSSTNATECNAFGTGWSGRVALAGSQKVNPSVTSTYMLVCIGDGGSAVQGITITVTSSNGTLQTASVANAFDQLTNNSTAPSAQTQSGFTYTWNRNLQYNSPYTADVTALQQALTIDGVYSGPITGGFYSLTYAAVKRFQSKYDIESTGFVGPLTRAQLNQLFSK